MIYTFKSKTEDELFDLDSFLNPNVEHFPVYCWSWNCKVSKDEIAHKLREFHDNNIFQIYILPEPHAFRPLTGNNMQPDYLTEDFFEIIKFTFEQAESLGMKLMIYDEGGWPSGSACGKVLESNNNLARKQILYRTVSSPYVPGENAVSAFCEGKRVYEGFSSDSEITEYYFEIIPGDYPNLLEKAATDTFIKLTHEGYKNSVGHMFGDSVTAVFTDEPVADKTSWCSDFETLFYEKYGYNICDHLPYIVCDSKLDVDELGQKVRIDYYDLLSEIFCKNFFLNVRDWCRRNNLIFTGHLDKDNATYDENQRFYQMLRQLRAFDMPGIDMIWRQIFPGKDNHFYPRFASSAANQTGNPNSISESFAIYGAGLTFEQMRYLILYQMVRGINVFNFMSMTYSYYGINMRGARPGYDSRFPMWQHLCLFNLYTARMCYLIKLGNAYTDVAVYLSMKDIWAGGIRSKKALDLFDSTVKYYESHNFCIEIIDDDFLESAYIDGAYLCTGNAKYNKIWLPDGLVLSDKIRIKLNDFIKNGGVIINEHNFRNITPSVSLSSDDIVINKRVFNGGCLYLLHNQTESDKTFSYVFPEKGAIYEIDVASGILYQIQDDKITLLHGEGKFFIVSEASYPSAFKKCYNNCIVISDFQMRRLSRFIFGENDFEKHLIDDEYIKVKPCDWCKYYGNDYSGEVFYKAEFQFETIPDQIEIDLGKVNYSCDIELNGVHIADLCFAPFKCTVDGKLLDKTNSLVIKVANTNANAVVSAKFLDEIPEEIIGQYHKIAKQFESESLESGLLSDIKIYY